VKKNRAAAHFSFSHSRRAYFTTLQLHTTIMCRWSCFFSVAFGSRHLSKNYGNQSPPWPHRGNEAGIARGLNSLIKCKVCTIIDFWIVRYQLKRNMNNSAIHESIAIFLSVCTLILTTHYSTHRAREWDGESRERARQGLAPSPSPFYNSNFAATAHFMLIYGSNNRFAQHTASERITTRKDNA